ncbi:Hsp20/alpha crystallin family protein [Treponema primitia]|uniref:Hsp20/alpha crystallin family protein n=1 Tax=Treponema primitia TaxID=88058 RepID=UPI000255552E|nr:Hsp20/alpha crystallin family protein [Treponema primitia]
MKGNRSYMDMGTIFDEIFEAAQNFTDEFQRNFNPLGGDTVRGGDPLRGEGCGRRGPFAKGSFDEHVDYYPNYSYPPMNVYMTADRSMIFEFALAGFDEKDISLSFQGDYMVFSARVNDDSGFDLSQEENFRYFKRRLKMKDIEKQKYYVPLDKYAQEQVKAVYKNGILRVSIPPKDEPDQNDGIKIEIIKEGN